MKTTGGCRVQSNAVRFVFENATDSSREKRWRGTRMEGDKVVEVISGQSWDMFWI